MSAYSGDFVERCKNLVKDHGIGFYAYTNKKGYSSVIYMTAEQYSMFNNKKDLRTLQDLIWALDHGKVWRLRPGPAIVDNTEQVEKEWSWP